MSPSRKALAASLCRAAEVVLAAEGFLGAGLILNRTTSSALVQACDVQLSKYVTDQYAFVNLGIYSADVARVLDWPEATESPVDSSYCQVRDRLLRHDGSEGWPLSGAIEELQERMAHLGLGFFRRADSPQALVAEWESGAFRPSYLPEIVVAIFADRIGRSDLTERILRDEIRTSQGHPSLPFVVRTAKRMGYDRLVG